MASGHTASPSEIWAFCLPTTMGMFGTKLADLLIVERQPDREVFRKKFHRAGKCGPDIGLTATGTGQIGDGPRHLGYGLHGKALLPVLAALGAGQYTDARANGRHNTAYPGKSTVAPMSLLAGPLEHLPDVIVGEVRAAFVFQSSHESTTGNIGVLTTEHGQSRKAEGEFRDFVGTNRFRGQHNIFDYPHGVVVVTVLTDIMTAGADNMARVGPLAVAAGNIPRLVVILQDFATDHAMLGLSFTTLVEIGLTRRTSQQDLRVIGCFKFFRKS